LPVVKDLVVDMEPFWAKFRAVDPYLQDGGKAAPDRENRISQQRMNVVHKESLCINCGCCVSECNAMESSPEFLGPQALAKAIRQTRFALGLFKHGKVPPPFPPHSAKRVREAKLLHDLVGLQGRGGYAGIVQGEAALAKLAHGVKEGRDPYGPGSFPKPFLPP